MKKQFLTSISLLLLLNFLIKPIYIFGIEPAVQNRLGNVDYGFYFSLFGFSFIFNTILDLGLTNFNSKNIAQNFNLLQGYFSRIFVIKLTLGFVYLLLIFLLSLITGYSSTQIKLLFILALNQFITSFVLYLRSNISALHLFKTDSVLSIMDRVILIILCVLMLWGNVFGTEFTIYHFVIAQTISYLVAFFTALFIVLQKIDKFHLHFDIKYFGVILRKSLPFATLVFLMSSYKWFDSFIIERILPHPIGKEQAGIYAQSFRLVDGMAQYGYLFSVILLPMFSRMIKKRESIYLIYRIASILLLLPIILLTVDVVLFRKEIIVLFYNVDSHSSSDILGFLIFTLLFSSWAYINGTLLTANNNLRLLNLFAGITLALNIILNLLLIPHFNAYGAAVTSFVSNGFMAIIQLIAVIKIFKIKIDFIILAKIVVSLVVSLIIGFYIKSVSDNWIIPFLLFPLTGIICALALKVVNLGNVKAIFFEK